jgi:hypothetical protein
VDEKISISNYTLSASVSAPLYPATHLVDLSYFFVTHDRLLAARYVF